MVNTQTTPQASQREAMSWIELLAEFSRTLHESLGGVLPDDFWRHARSARKEHLLAMRSLLDARITQLEQQESQEQERTATKISIE